MSRTRTLAAFVAAALAVTTAPAGEPNVVRPFNGDNLEGWNFKKSERMHHWAAGFAKQDADNPRELAFSEEVPEGEPPQLVNRKGGGVDIYTVEKYGDATIEVELMVPAGSNSGIYVMGEYEIQVLDSYGKEEAGPSDIGGLYGAAAPKVNAAKMPGEWQKFVIEFQAPRFKDGQKTSNAVFKKITLNGKLLHENVEMKGPTPSGVTGKEAEEGPLMFQGDHGPVAYRNIKITPAER